jgi:hypothetical protein
MSRKARVDVYLPRKGRVVYDLADHKVIYAWDINA